MFHRLTSMTALLPFFAVLFAVIGSIAAHPEAASVRRYHNAHHRFKSVGPPSTSNFPRAVESGTRKRLSCRASESSSLGASNITSTSSAKSTANPAAPKTTKASSTQNTNTLSGNNNNLKPAGWPAATQAGAAPAATRTSAADPFLLQLSDAFNNAGNALYNQVHTGQMTYYSQGLGACGDTYDDSSFTAAVSRLLYDSWPGATAEMNRNPICGPYVPGRKVLNQAGQFVTAVPGAQFVDIGGDGLLNCDASSQCHIPLTATVTHGDKSIQVKIVDRCEACAVGDIDMTPAAFAALADMSLGRTSVEWSFNKY